MKKIDLLRDDLRKIFIRYLIPGVLSSIAISLYIFVDTMFVGVGVGRYGLAALNISVPLFTLFTSLFLCIGIGGSNILSINRSEKNGEDGNKIFTNAMVFTLVLGIIISILGVIFVDEIGVFLGTSEEIKGLFREYFSILVGFTWAFLIAGVLGCFIRNDKNPKLAMIATIVANLVNVIFDYIFIFEFNLGMRGAVMATVMSPIVNILILLIHFKTKNNSLKLCKIRFDFKLIKKILGNGFGTFILEFCRGITIFLFNNVLVRLGGNTYVAAYGILLNVSYVIICIFSGIAQSTQPIVSSNYGANMLKRAKKSFVYGFSTSVIFGILSYIFVYIFAENLSRLFTKGDIELINITAHGMRVYFIGCMFMAFNIVTIYFFQSVNKAKKSILISMSSGIVFVILGFLILVPKLNILGVWLVFPFAEMLGFLVCIIVIFRNNLKNKEELIV